MYTTGWQHWRSSGGKLGKLPGWLPGGEHHWQGLSDWGLQTADSQPAGADGQDGGSLSGFLPVCLWRIYQQDCRAKRQETCRWGKVLKKLRGNGHFWHPKYFMQLLDLLFMSILLGTIQTLKDQLTKRLQKLFEAEVESEELKIYKGSGTYRTQWLRDWMICNFLNL